MRTLLIVIVALAAAPAIEAQPESAYYGLALGNFDYDERVGFDNERVTDSTNSWRLMVGYQFLEHLGVEGGYGQTGTLRDTATVPTFPSGTVDLTFAYEFKILTVRLLGILPFDNGLSLLGGVGYSDMKINFDLTDGVDTLSGDDSTNEPGYYIGAQYDWDRLAIRVGYEKFDFDGDVDVSETMITFFYKI